MRALHSTPHLPPPSPPSAPQSLAEADNRLYPVPSSKDDRSSSKKDKKRDRGAAAAAAGPPLAEYGLEELVSAGELVRAEVDFVRQVGGVGAGTVGRARVGCGRGRASLQ